MSRTRVFQLALIIGCSSLLANAQVLDTLLEDEQIWKVGQETGDGVGVIVHLQGDEAVTFEKNARADKVAEAVAHRQRAFLSLLKSSGLSVQHEWCDDPRVCEPRAGPGRYDLPCLGCLPARSAAL